MYEERGVEAVLARMQKTFRHAFAFDYQVDGADVTLDFHPCGLKDVVEKDGGKVGEAVICQLFHEYWAGLLTTFVGERYRYEMPKTGAACQMKLSV